MIKHMLGWPNPFKRKPKGYRFPNGIPRVEVTGKPTSGTYTVNIGLRTETYDRTGKLIEVTFPAIDHDRLELLKTDPAAFFGTRSDRPWVIFEDGDDK